MENKAPNLVWLEINQNLQEAKTSLQEHLTNESGSSFITNIKSFFSNTLLKIIDSVNSLFKTYTITDKYFKDNVKDLSNLNKTLAELNSLKFSDIANKKMKCVTGMSLDYLSTTKELKQFLPFIKNIKNDIDKMSSFIENVINNLNDTRQSNNRKIDVENLIYVADKTNAIIAELINGKSPIDEKPMTELFPNIMSFKMVRDELLNINTTLQKSDIDDIKKSIDRLISVTTIWLKNTKEEKDVVYSTATINQLQYGIESLASITTSFSMFIVLSNQFTSYYLTTMQNLKDHK